MLEVVRTSETSVNFNVTTRGYIKENSKLYTRSCEKLKSYKFTAKKKHTGNRLEASLKSMVAHSSQLLKERQIDLLVLNAQEAILLPPFL
jgi:hypothetical protein